LVYAVAADDDDDAIQTNNSFQTYFFPTVTDVCMGCKDTDTNQIKDAIRNVKKSKFKYKYLILTYEQLVTNISVNLCQIIPLDSSIAYGAFLFIELQDLAINAANSRI
jgi:competence transcription factor ComK